MKNITEINKDTCVGCGACVQSCPVACIRMSLDGYGFLYPQIGDSCINCGKCLTVCPAARESAADECQDKPCYILTAKNKILEDKSASGGFCAILADYYIDKFDAVVFGCVMDDSFEVCHQAITHREDIYKIQGSKYVQSNTLNTYKEAQDYLNTGRCVLYMATPCQIAGLKTFLTKRYENLITVDIICHGVPSSKAFQLYIKHLSDTNKTAILEYKFRNKTCYDRTGFISKTKYNRGKTVYKRPSEDIYFYLFSKGKSYRKSCYNCQYACLARQGDFTCGDCGSRSLYNDFMPYEAVSSLILNTEKAISIWNEIKALFEYIQIDLKTEALKNKQLHECTALPSDRDVLCKAMINSQWNELKVKYLPKNKISFFKTISERIPISVKKIICRLMLKDSKK